MLFKDIIDRQMPQKNLAGILWEALLMAALLLLHQFFSVRGASRIGKAVTEAILDLRAQIFHKVQYLSFSYLDRQQTGRLLAKYAFDTQKIDGLATSVLNGFLPNSLYSLLTLGILVAMNWQLSAVILLMLPIMGFMRAYYFARLQGKHEQSRKAQERLTGVASEYFGALRLVRSYGQEDRVGSRLLETNQEVARSQVELIHVSASFGAFSWGAIQFLSLVVVAGGATLSILGQVGPGTVLAFVTGLPPLVQPLQMFTHLSEQYFQGQEAYNSIRELLEEPQTEHWHGRERPATLQGAIEFQHVSFTYPGSDRPALREFSLCVAPGERLALVGPSGAGKSTVTSLLLGLYTPDSGQVEVDGIAQADLEMRWFRQQVALVMQESILLSGTIGENIRFGRPNARDEEVVEAARLAHADEFIQKMPDGFDTVVGERGAMLSGGQRQRISIARALLRDPAILILDEPTSALDYESERLIQQALDNLTRGRTVVTIAHRLSTILNADRIVVLDEGRIVEQGTFTELRDQKGYFHQMLIAHDPVPSAGLSRTQLPG